jgi:glycosyltransferase involved in cell wall biosynthesis
MVTRVAAILAAEDVSVPARQLAALGPALAQHDIQLHLLLLQRDTTRLPPLAGYLEQVGMQPHLIRDRGPADWGIVSSVRNTLKGIGVTLVQTHGYKATAVGWVLRRAHGARPWVGFYHGATEKGIMDRLYQRLELRLLTAADRVVVITRQQAALLSAAGDKLQIIENAATSIPRGHSDETQRVAARMERVPGPRIGVVGRLSPEKGVDLFLRACGQLRDSGHRFGAVLAGDGPSEKMLRSLAADLQLTDRVTFLGRVDDVQAVMDRLDLLVLPSRTEGLPNTLLEGVAAGVQVIATDVGSAGDVLRVAGYGTSVPPEDATALAEAIAAALDVRQKPTADARRRTLERYSLDRRVAEHVRLYRELAKASVAFGPRASCNGAP